MNTYSKYCPNVFVAKCTEAHSRGEVIEIETRYGNSHEVEVHNFLYQKDGFFFYSITRTDGYNVQERARQKAERYANWAAAADKRSTQAFERSTAAVEGIPFGQPILVGHHSEKHHRAAVEKSWNAMDKSVEEGKKAALHTYKAEYWKGKESTINLSMPESVEYYEFKLEHAKLIHAKLIEKPELRAHDYSLTYAKKDVNNFKKLLETAKKLWE